MTTGTLTGTRLAATLLLIAVVSAAPETIANKNSFKCTQLSGTDSITCQSTQLQSYENEKFLSSIESVSSMASELTDTKTEDDWTKKLPLHWYTLALILIFLLQILICCGMVMWTKSKIKDMGK